MTYRGFLAEMLMAECEDRDDPARTGQLAMITIPALRSATRPGVSPGGAMIVRAMIALVARRLAAAAD